MKAFMNGLGNGLWYLMLFLIVFGALSMLGNFGASMIVPSAIVVWLYIKYGKGD